MSVWHCSHLQCIINALPPGHGRPLQGPKSTVRILSLTSLFLSLHAVTWRLVTLSGLSVCCCCLCHLLLLLQFLCLQRSLLLARGQSWGSLVRLLQVITVADGAGLTECIRTSERPFKDFLTCEVFEEYSTDGGSKHTVWFTQVQFQRKHLNLTTAKKLIDFGCKLVP